MPTELTRASAQELSRLYARGKASPTEALQAVLARTDRVNPIINVFCHIDRAHALSAARASERRWRRGRPLSPLDGVPVSVKELVAVRGWPLSMGSRLTGAACAREDSTVVARLREAGAVLFAQTTSPEFGHKGVTDSPRHGITRNPWQTDRTPGGSSGGCGAAVAAGLGPVSIGTDGGGSIRIPSSFCGLVGLKATFGRVPAWPPSLVGDLANTGPMTRTVGDCALTLNVLARPDARDPYALPPDDTDYTRLPGRGRALRVALILKMGDHVLDREVAEKVKAAARRFESMGWLVDEVRPPFAFDRAVRCFGIHWFAAMQRLMAGYPEARHADFDTSLQAQARAARAYTLGDFAQAQADRRDLAFAWSQLFTRHDLVLTPMVAVPPFAVGTTAPPGANGKPNVLWTPYSATFNLSRHPAITVPCGRTRDGLPIGLQLVATHYREALLLGAAARYARAEPFRIPELPLA